MNKTKPLTLILGILLAGILILFLIVLLYLLGEGHYENLSFGDVFGKIGPSFMLLGYAIKKIIEKKEEQTEKKPYIKVWTT